MILQSLTLAAHIVASSGAAQHIGLGAAGHSLGIAQRPVPLASTGVRGPYGHFAAMHPDHGASEKRERNRGNRVIYAITLVAREKPTHHSKPVATFAMGDVVHWCPHPKKRQSISVETITRRAKPGEKATTAEVEWRYVAREGDSCDDAVGWIPLQVPTTGLCRNYGSLPGPTCWDFWNWSEETEIPVGTKQIACPASINQRRSRHATESFSGNPIGTTLLDDLLRCGTLAVASTAAGSAGKLAGMNWGLSEAGTKIVGGVAATLAGVWVHYGYGLDPKMKKYRDHIVVPTLVAAAGTTAIIRHPAISFGIGAPIATAICMYFTLDVRSHAYPPCNRKKRPEAIAWAEDLATSMQLRTVSRSWVHSAWGGAPALARGASRARLATDEPSWVLKIRETANRVAPS